MNDSAPTDGDQPVLLNDLPSWLLTNAAAHAHRIVNDGLATVGARRFHYRVLTALAAEGPMSQADLGRRTDIHLSDMVATVNELADQRFVERTQNTQDRRRNVITLTEAGRGQLRALAQQVVQIQNDLLAPLTADERDQLTASLRKLVAYHQRRGDTAQP